MRKTIFLLTLFNISVFSFGQSNIVLPDSVEISEELSPIRKYPFHASEIIQRASINQKFALTAVKWEGFFEVRYKSFVGYVNYSYVKNGAKIFDSKFPKQTLAELNEIKKNDSIAEIFNKKSKQASKEFFESLKRGYIKKYGQVIGEKIAKRMIWIGMTEAMLLDSWGRPNDINTTVTRYGTSKQYVYGSGRYVYVENGKVDAWQN